MFCSNCGTKVDDPNTAFCVNCGSPISKQSKDVSSTPQATPVTTKELMTLEQLRTTVETYLREGKIIYQVQPGGTLVIRYGTTAAFIQFAHVGDRTCVLVAAPVAHSIAKITPELTRFIAETNEQLLFGKFTLDSKNMAVFYKHALLGDFLDREELIQAVAVVVSTADNYDEQVTKMVGGKRVIDK